MLTSEKQWIELSSAALTAAIETLRRGDANQRQTAADYCESILDQRPEVKK